MLMCLFILIDIHGVHHFCPACIRVAGRSYQLYVRTFGRDADFVVIEVIVVLVQFTVVDGELIYGILVFEVDDDKFNRVIIDVGSIEAPFAAAFFVNAVDKIYGGLTLVDAIVGFHYSFTDTHHVAALTDERAAVFSVYAAAIDTHGIVSLGEDSLYKTAFDRGECLFLDILAADACPAENGPPPLT